MENDPETKKIFSGRKTKAIFCMILLLLVFLAGSLVLSRSNPDEGIFTTGGWLLLNGTVLYNQFFSMYSPGLYFILAAFYAIFPADFVLSRLFVIAVNALTAACFFLLCRKIMSEKPALLALLFYVIWSVFTISWNVIIEPFIALFSVLLFYFVFSFLHSKKLGHLACAGFFLSALVLLKQTTLFLSIAVFIFILLRSKLNRKQFLAFAFSSAFPLLLFLFYLLSNNALAAFVEQAIIHNLSHSQLFIFRLHLDWVAITAFFFSLPALALLLLARGKIQVERDKALLLFIWLFTLLPTLLPVMGCCVHFMPLVAPFAVFFGLLSGQALVKSGSAKPNVGQPFFLKIFLCLFFALSVAGSMAYLSQYFFQNGLQDLFEIAEYVQSNSTASDRIFGTYWDEQMYFLSLRKPATKYAYTPFLFPEEIAAYQLETIDAMRKTKPLFVVHFSATEQWVKGDDKIQEYVLESFRLAKTFKLRKPLYKTFNYALIFKRKG